MYAWKLILEIFYPTKASGDSTTNVWEVPKKEQFIIDKNMICAEEVWGQSGLDYITCKSLEGGVPRGTDSLKETRRCW